MDIASLVGLIAGIFFIISSILLKGELDAFMDLPSVMITIGGTFSATLISYPIKKFLNSFKAIGHIFKSTELNESEVIKKIIDLSNIARKEGLLALEEAAEEINDDFLKKGILLIVDGTDPELVRNILETEMAFIENRHKDVRGFWEDIGSFSPAWGMIGTLIGLINMLKTLDDPSSIGPNMSVALLTTLYGSLLANFFAIPAANKLKVRSLEEVLLKEVMIEGLLSIQAGENPRVIEEKLKAFLAPTLRERLNDSEEVNEEKEGEA
ncbi:MAG: motility protein A [Eubacteriales bacterium]